MNNENREKNDLGIWEIGVDEVRENRNALQLVDVREPDEFVGELGHIDGANSSSIQTALMDYLPTLSKEQTYVFICRSGKRSSRAAKLAVEQGFPHVYNMKGGMMEWNRRSFPVTSD